MKNRYLVTLHGKSTNWGIIHKMTAEDAVNLSNDGIDVALMIYDIPAWVEDWGLRKPWCFAQDIFNFRNPFANR